jgi:sodium transport system permease protein
MKNKILLVAKKEWYRFFTDRRMVISALVFPCVFLYVVYALFVPLIIEISGNDKNAIVYAINPPDIIKAVLEQANIDLTVINENEKNSIMEGIEQKNGNILIEFSDNFINEAETYEAMSGLAAPEIFIYYNSLSASYPDLYVKILTGLSIYERSLARKFDVNITGGGDTAEAGAPERHLLAFILPVFLLLFIFQGAMATTTEAITGEKERGTFAAVFLTSITPIELSLGKILGLGIQAFLCGVSASLGLILSLPRLIESFSAMLSQGQSALQLNIFSLELYGIGDIGMLILILLATACFIVTLIAIIAINARTAKEAQMFAYPMIIVLLFVSFLTTFNSGDQSSIFFYFIPVCSSIQIINDIINQNWIPLNMAAAMGVNILLTVFGSIILSRLFKTEKILIV